jgi:hypothetical protein
MAATESGYKPATIRHRPERFVSLTAWATARGLPLGVPMTKVERRIIAVIAAQPTHTLTVDSQLASHPEMAAAFRLLVKRLNRGLAKRSPMNPKSLIYVASLASARNSGRFHVHALLWSYIHAPVLHGHCGDLGLGKPKLRRLPGEPTGDANYWQQVVYVMGQNEPAFGFRKYRSNEPPPLGARRLLTPRRATLDRHCPQLLSALDIANDPTVPDETLLSRLPKFSSSR